MHRPVGLWHMILSYILHVLGPGAEGYRAYWLLGTIRYSRTLYHGNFVIVSVSLVVNAFLPKFAA